MPTNPPKVPPPPLPKTSVGPAAPAPQGAPHERGWWTEWRITLFALAVGVLLGGFGALQASALSQSRDNHTILERVDDVNAIIKDSVDPGGKRFQQGQASTAAAVGAINEITVLAAYCAKASTDLPTIQGCVRAEYARMHPPAAP